MSVANFRGFTTQVSGYVQEILSCLRTIPEHRFTFPNHTPTQSLDHWRNTINQNLINCDRVMDEYIHRHFPTAPQPVTRKSLVFALKNEIIHMVNANNMIFETGDQEAMCQFTESVFLGLFGETLAIPRLLRDPPDPGTPPFEQPGHRIRRDGDLPPENSGAREVEPPYADPEFEMHGHDRSDSQDVPGRKRPRTDLDFQNACVIIDNLHRRLSALEQRVGK